MQEERSFLQFLAKHKKSVITFLLFIAYAGAVFWSNYQSLHRIQDNARIQFQLEAEKQASAISYFFSERRIETTELAESEPVVNFFRNLDLGMSFQYGLGVNVQLIEDRFQTIANKKRVNDHPVFSGFMLIDNAGALVAEWNAPQKGTRFNEWLMPENHATRTRMGVRKGTVVIMAPVWTNDRYRGELLAWINTGTSFAQFGSARSERHSLLVNRLTGETLHSETGTPSLQLDYWQAFSDKTAQGNGTHIASFAHEGNNYNIARFDIKEMPVSFISISPMQATDDGMSRLFVIAAGVIPFVVLLVGFLDVLERRRLENLRIVAQTEAERLAQARSDFLANMSHEIRTPMNAIIGMTELCLASKPSQKQRNYLTKIQQTSDLLLRIINDILDFSKIESGKLDIDKSPFDLNRTLSDVGNLLSDKAGKKSIEIAFDVDDSCNRIFVGDSMRLEQILINLIGNAIKFSEQGNVIVRVRCDETAPDAARLNFDIIDEGIGITEEQQARLFCAFTQADATTTRRFGGTGLGLAICKRLVELMGGTIKVVSRPGQGSTFSFSVLMGVDPDQESRFIALKKKLSLFAGRQVLVVDDNPVYRQALATQLGQIGLSCKMCVSGEDAIAEISNNVHADYLAILVDLHMPGWTGLETIRELRNIWPGGSVPPIFLLTTYSLDVDLEEDSFMFDGILTKPTTANQLYSEIAPFLGIKIDPEFLPRSGAVIAPDRLCGLDVLLVDDVPFNQEVVRDMLQDAGMSVRIANNGSEALSAITEKCPDCILMDCQMPVMDGYEATRRIRKNIKYRNLPIIALTANALASEREKCRLAGMDGYVVKPVKTADLLAAVIKHAPPKANYREAHTVPPPAITAPSHSNMDLIADLPGIDFEAGLRFANGRVANYHKILHLFLETHGRDFAGNLRNALENENWDEAARHAHSFKSAARTIGANHLGQLGKELEDACHEGEHERARQILESLLLELQIVCAGLATLPSGN